MSVFDLAVIQDGRLVQLNTTTMYRSRERYFIRVEEFPTRPADDFVRSITQYRFDRGGHVQQPGVQGKICVSYQMISNANSLPESSPWRLTVNGDERRLHGVLVMSRPTFASRLETIEMSGRAQVSHLMLPASRGRASFAVHRPGLPSPRHGTQTRRLYWVYGGSDR